MADCCSQEPLQAGCNFMSTDTVTVTGDGSSAAPVAFEIAATDWTDITGFQGTWTAHDGSIQYAPQYKIFAGFVVYLRGRIENPGVHPLGSTILTGLTAIAPAQDVFDTVASNNGLEGIVRIGTGGTWTSLAASEDWISLDAISYVLS